MALLLSGFLVVVASLALTSRAAAVGRTFWGVQYPNLSLSSEDLTRLDQGKVGTIRFYLPWAWLESTKRDPANWNWGASDRFVQHLANRGIRGLAVLSGSPGWTGEPDTNYPPLDTQEAKDGWKQYLRQVVKRYGPHGDYWQSNSGPDLPIRTWQIWRETNLKRFFAPKASVSRYIDLLRLSHPTIRGVDPHARIALAGMPDYRVKFPGSTYLRQLYKHRGVKRLFELVGIHAYSPNVAYLRKMMRRWRRVERRHHDRQVHNWITEIGWGSAPPQSGGNSLNRGPEGQRDLLRKSYHVLKKRHRRWRLGLVTWFTWKDPANPPQTFCDFCVTSGLLDGNLDPKPVWSAFNHFTHGGS
jgi:hypothetical protein